MLYFPSDPYSFLPEPDLLLSLYPTSPPSSIPLHIAMFSDRDQANVLLNATRGVYEPNALMGALSPRILDIPERMKTALMQYMGAVLPSCTLFFSSPQNTGKILVVLLFSSFNIISRCDLLLVFYNWSTLSPLFASHLSYTCLPVAHHIT